MCKKICISSKKYNDFRTGTINYITKENVGIDAIKLNIQKAMSPNFLDRFKNTNELQRAIFHKECVKKLVKDKVFLDFVFQRFNEPLFTKEKKHHVAS